MKKLLTVYCVFFTTLFLFSCNKSGSENSQNSETPSTPPLEQWYTGGTLHQATISEWKSATEKNKLATCADFVANVKKANNDSYNGDLKAMKHDATQMMACIDESVKGDGIEKNKVNEIAAMCAILLGN